MTIFRPFSTATYVIVGVGLVGSMMFGTPSKPTPVIETAKPVPAFDGIVDTRGREPLENILAPQYSYNWDYNRPHLRNEIAKRGEKEVLRCWIGPHFWEAYWRCVALIDNGYAR